MNNEYTNQKGNNSHGDNEEDIGDMNYLLEHNVGSYVDKEAPVDA